MQSTVNSRTYVWVEDEDGNVEVSEFSCDLPEEPQTARKSDKTRVALVAGASLRESCDLIARMNQAHRAGNARRARQLRERIIARSTDDHSARQKIAKLRRDGIAAIRRGQLPPNDWQRDYTVAWNSLHGAVKRCEECHAEFVPTRRDRFCSQNCSARKRNRGRERVGNGKSAAENAAHRALQRARRSPTPENWETVIATDALARRVAPLDEAVDGSARVQSKRRPTADEQIHAKRWR